MVLLEEGDLGLLLADELAILTNGFDEVLGLIELAPGFEDHLDFFLELLIFVQQIFNRKALLGVGGITHFLVLVNARLGQLRLGRRKQRGLRVASIRSPVLGPLFGLNEILLSLLLAVLGGAAGLADCACPFSEALDPLQGVADQPLELFEFKFGASRVGMQLEPVDPFGGDLRTILVRFVLGESAVPRQFPIALFAVVVHAGFTTYQ